MLQEESIPPIGGVSKSWYFLDTVQSISKVINFVYDNAEK